MEKCFPVGGQFDRTDGSSDYLRTSTFPCCSPLRVGLASLSVSVLSAVNLTILCRPLEESDGANRIRKDAESKAKVAKYVTRLCRFWKSKASVAKPVNCTDDLEHYEHRNCDCKI